MRPAADGIDYGVCVPRDLQDVELVESAREQGVEVRERCTVEALRWRAGRVVGLRYRQRRRSEHEVGATLVVGADGRRSTVASLVGAWTPYRLSRNGRGLVFRYLDDPLAGTVDAETYYQWREDKSFAFAFPTTPAGRLLVLLMGHRDEAGEARRDPEGYWLRKLAEHPGLAARVAGAPPGSKLRSTGETPAFFRASSGPGWALAGDAGHFKDPVTGQGMRDAMFAGRTLAEQVLPVLDDPVAVDRDTRSWEAARDRECLPAYHFANADTRTERPSPRSASSSAMRAGRRARISATCSAAPARHSRSHLRPASRALFSWPSGGASDRARNRARAVSDVRTEVEIRLERRADRFRSTRPRHRLRAPRSFLARTAGRGPLRSLRAGAAPAAGNRGSRLPSARGQRRSLAMTRIAVVQPALELGQVEQNLARVEDLIRDAHREHDPEVIVVPEGFTTPNVYAKVLRGTARPVDGQPLQMLTHLARELDCVLAGGFVAVRGGDTYGTFVLAEPDGAVHLHDKDIPTAWEQHYYVGGDDPGVVAVRDARLRRRPDVGLGVGSISHGRAGARRGREARAGWHVLAVDAAQLAGAAALVGTSRARDLASPGARAARPGRAPDGVPVAHASHVGPGAGRNSAGPRHPLARPQMLGESQICDRDGTVLARLTLEDGEGHVAADVALEAPAPLDAIQDRFWIPKMTLTTHVAWHAMNTHGALSYRVRHARRGFDWQDWPAGDLPDDILPASAGEAPAATTTDR